MATRGNGLQHFIDAAYVAFDQHVRDFEGRRSTSQIFGLLEDVGEQREGEGCKLPVCDHLLEALSVQTKTDSLRRLLARFQAVEPQIIWRRREDTAGTASGDYWDGHGNGIIIGPGGIEVRSDVWLGVTLMAPGVRYPDHHHGPEETYLVASAGEFKQGDTDWFSPGVGGTFFNPADIKHAMRSLDTPLLAFWALRPDRRRSGSTNQPTGYRP